MAQTLLADRTASAPAASALPLCVDWMKRLYGRIRWSRTSWRWLSNPRLLQTLAALPLSGRAAFKQRVARAASLDPALLPYNEELLDWLRTQKAAGRMLVLVTAADVALARAVVDYLGLFDEVIASDGACDLKGKAKARALAAASARWASPMPATAAPTWSYGGPPPAACSSMSRDASHRLSDASLPSRR